MLANQKLIILILNSLKLRKDYLHFIFVMNGYDDSFLILLKLKVYILRVCIICVICLTLMKILRLIIILSRFCSSIMFS